MRLETALAKKLSVWISGFKQILKVVGYCQRSAINVTLNGGSLSRRNVNIENEKQHRGSLNFIIGLQTYTQAIFYMLA